MSKAEKAMQLHRSRYNCCQAVACAYAEDFGLDTVTAFKISEGFGGGCGNAEGICGALAGAIMMAGMKNSDGNLEAPGTKGETAALSRKIMALFKEKTGAIICKDLKGIETGVMLCSCPNCVKAGAECVEEVLLGI